MLKVIKENLKIKRKSHKKTESIKKEPTGHSKNKKYKI